jgi:hypothetical protein
MKKLSQLELPFKLLVTMFLIVLSCGFAVAHLYLQFTTEMADGKPGLGLDDITYTYHGNPTATTFKHFATGPMKKYFSEVEDDTKLNAEEIADFEQVIKWNDEGAKEAGYWDPELKGADKNPKSVYRILLNRGCLDCHAADATMKGNKKDSPLDSFANISKFTKPDTGMPVGRLLALMHIHLLGMGMMVTLVGTAVAFTSWPTKVRCALIVGGLSSVLFDVLGWSAVKFGGGTFSPLVMLGGGLMAAYFAISVPASLYDIWLRKTKPEDGTP